MMCPGKGTAVLQRGSGPVETRTKLSISTHGLVFPYAKARTAIKYFESWPNNNVGPGFHGNDVGVNLEKRDCH